MYNICGYSGIFKDNIVVLSLICVTYMRIFDFIDQWFKVKSYSSLKGIDKKIFMQQH